MYNVYAIPQPSVKNRFECKYQIFLRSTPSPCVSCHDAESAPVAKPGLQAGKPKPKSAAELVAEMAGRFAPAASDSVPAQPPPTSAAAFLATMKDAFAPASGASGTKLEEQVKPVGTVGKEENRVRPTRAYDTWQPAPLLCKRFGVRDPFPNKDTEVVKKSKVVRGYTQPSLGMLDPSHSLLLPRDSSVARQPLNTKSNF